VGPKAAASVGPKVTAALSDGVVAVEVPVWRSGRWRSQGTGMEESGGARGSLSSAGGGHSHGEVRADRQR
jgi:hypothetical protein